MDAVVHAFGGGRERIFCSAFRRIFETIADSVRHDLLLFSAATAGGRPSARVGTRRRSGLIVRQLEISFPFRASAGKVMTTGFPSAEVFP